MATHTHTQRISTTRKNGERKKRGRVLVITVVVVVTRFASFPKVKDDNYYLL
jgi:hypothetical protein